MSTYVIVAVFSLQNLAVLASDALFHLGCEKFVIESIPAMSSAQRVRLESIGILMFSEINVSFFIGEGCGETVVCSEQPKPRRVMHVDKYR